MTYVQPSEQFAARIPARGQSTSTSPFLNARLGLNQLGGIFTAVGDWMMRIAETQSRSDRIAALEAKTDAELASRNGMSWRAFCVLGGVRGLVRDDAGS